MGAGEALLPPVAKPGTHTPSFLQQIYQCLSVGALAVASYFIISHFFLQSVEIVGVSMQPTLHNSEHYLLNRWVYYVRPPRHTDVVVIRDPVDNGYSVKRVIGTSGDFIHLKDGKVFVNGKKLFECYLPVGTPTYPYAKVNEQSFRCGRDEYFVLGDNRKNSADSRVYGVLPRRNILGLIAP